MLAKTYSSIQFKSNDWEENYLDIMIQTLMLLVSAGMYIVLSMCTSFWYFIYLFQYNPNILFPSIVYCIKNRTIEHY